MEIGWARREDLRRSRIRTQHQAALHEVAQGAGSDTRPIITRTRSPGFIVGRLASICSARKVASPFNMTISDRASSVLFRSGGSENHEKKRNGLEEVAITALFTFLGRLVRRVWRRANMSRPSAAFFHQYIKELCTLITALGGYKAGFSIHCSPIWTLTGGYVVSLAGRTQTFGREPTDRELSEFVFKNWDLLRRESVIFGGWQDNCTYYMDVNMLYIRRNAAIKRGMHERQIAIWDVKGRNAISCNTTQT